MRGLVPGSVGSTFRDHRNIKHMLLILVMELTFIVKDTFLKRYTGAVYKVLLLVDKGFFDIGQSSYNNGMKCTKIQANNVPIFLHNLKKSRRVTVGYVHVFVSWMEDVWSCGSGWEGRLVMSGICVCVCVCVCVHLGLLGIYLPVSISPVLN